MREHSLPQLSASLANYDLFRKNDKLFGKFSPLSEIVLISSFFPRRVFDSTSPNYEIYSRISKLVTDERERIGIKWLALSLYSASAADYRNLEFLNILIDRVRG